MSGFPVPDTEGHRLLQQLQMRGTSQVKLAAAIGVSRQLVQMWTVGRKTPGPEVQEKLLALYQIPLEAWECAPGGVAAIPAPVPAAPSLSEKLTKAAPLPGPPDPAPSFPAPPRPGDTRRSGKRTVDRGSGTTSEALEGLLREVREDIARGGLLPSEVARLRDSESRLLAQRAKLERERELLEDRIVRDHPAWKRLQRTILKALEPHPVAAKAVLAAIEDSIGRG